MQIETKGVVVKKQSLFVYTENVKRLRERISGDFFKVLCLDGAKEQFRNSRLTKAKLKQYLVQRYGPLVTDKVAMILDFNNPVDFGSFTTQVENFLKNKDLLR